MPHPQSVALTDLLHRVQAGEAGARNALFERVHSDLRRMAAKLMRHQQAGHTLSATGLVHELFIKNFPDQSAGKDSGEFFRIAATAMQRLLVDHARRSLSRKRGGDRRRVDFAAIPEVAAGQQLTDSELLGIHDFLEDSDVLTSRQREVVSLRFWCGLTNLQVAQALGLSEATVRREWDVAKAWLRRSVDGKLLGNNSGSLLTQAEKSEPSRVRSSGTQDR